MKILAIIPAREGSKRVPQKNFRSFAGTTLTELALHQAIGSRLITDIALSSDSNEVLALANSFSDVIKLQRPSAISGDHAPAIEYVHHALGVLEKPDSGFDIVVILQPSSPLRTPEDVDSTIKLLIAHPEADSAVSIMKVDHMVHPLKMKRKEGDLLLPLIEDENGRFAAHQLPDVYVRNCAVYATWRRGIENRTDVVGENSVGYLMPPERSIDINEKLDFDFAEYLYQRKWKG